MGSKRNGYYQRSNSGLIMKTTKYIVIIYLLISLHACTLFIPQPELSLRKGFDGKDIAVLDFAVKGMHISQFHGVYAADKLSERLFLSNQYTTIDRSLIREAERLVGVNSASPLSADQIQKLGLRVKAKYLILGNVYALSKSDSFDFDTESEIQISFRIVSVATGEVLGAVTYKTNDSDDIIENTISAMVNKMIEKMQGENS